MDRNQILSIFKEATLLAKEVEPVIAKNHFFVEKQASLEKRAEEVSDVLVQYNIVDIEKRAEVKKALHDAEYAYDLIIKLAGQIGPQSLGETGEVPGMSLGETPEQRFENWLLASY